MNGSLNKYFTISELVSACKTTKDTLYFYEKKGLIKPKFVDDNGYRYYDLENFYRLDMILTLRESKSSIKEISDFLDIVTPNKYVEYMDTRAKFFQKKQLEYKMLEEKINKSIILTKIGISNVDSEIFIEEQPSEYLIVYQASDLNDDAIIISAFSHIKEQCIKYNIPVDFHLSAIVSYDELINNNINSGFLYAKSYKKIKGEHIHVKPAGQYLTTIHKGDYNDLRISYNKLFEYVNKHNIAITGNSYEQTLIGWFNCKSRDEFITKISIKIK